MPLTRSFAEAASILIGGLLGIAFGNSLGAHVPFLLP